MGVLRPTFWNGLHLVDSYNRERTAMTKEIVTTPNAPSSPLYSQAVKAGGLVFVSGQVGQDPSTGKLAGSTVQEQTRQCLKNISAILNEAGSSIEKIVSATFILRNPDDFPGMNAEWATWFPENPPARQGASLPIDVDGLLVSFAVIAAE
jgi:2-iminobutanoate/2-iminopropanoate deaminase